VHDVNQVMHGDDQVMHGDDQVMHGENQVMHASDQVMHADDQVMHGDNQVMHAYKQYCIDGILGNQGSLQKSCQVLPFKTNAKAANSHPLIQDVLSHKVMGILTGTVTFFNSFNNSSTSLYVVYTYPLKVRASNGRRFKRP